MQYDGLLSLFGIVKIVNRSIIGDERQTIISQTVKMGYIL